MDSAIFHSANSRLGDLSKHQSSGDQPLLWLKFDILNRLSLLNIQKSYWNPLEVHRLMQQVLNSPILKF